MLCWSCWIGTGGASKPTSRQKFSVASVGVIYNQWGLTGTPLIIEAFSVCSTLFAIYYGFGVIAAHRVDKLTAISQDADQFWPKFYGNGVTPCKNVDTIQ